MPLSAGNGIDAGSTKHVPVSPPEAERRSSTTVGDLVVASLSLLLVESSSNSTSSQAIIQRPPATTTYSKQHQKIRNAKSVAVSIVKSRYLLLKTLPMNNTQDGARRGFAARCLTSRSNSR